MTDLQLSLLALGGVIIASVVLFNLWQERNMRREAAERFEVPQRDVLMEEEFHIDTEAVLRNEKPAASPSLRDLDYNEDDDTYPVQTAAPAASHVWRDTQASEAEPPMAAYAEEQQFSIPQVESQPAPTQADHYASSTASYTPPPQAARGLQDSFPATRPMPPETIAEAEELDTRYDGLPEGISHQIDLTAVLYLQQPATGAELRELVLALSGLDKPFYAHGLTADNSWYLLTREQEAGEFIRAAYTLQLADRSGPASYDTLNRFQHAVESLGQALGAQLEWQGNPDPLNYAIELDQFCIDVDKMVGFHIVQGPNGPFTGTKFRGLAEASGLVLADNGAFQFINENGVLYSLVNQDSIPFTAETLRTIVLRGISFQLDIPRVKHCAEVFNQMVLAAKQMENSLNASLVDDHQRPLGEVQIEKIRQQLKVIHAQMVARGVVPGSATALRLFS